MHWIIDWETLSNCSALCAEHYKTNEQKDFVIHELRNDLPKLIEFIEECKKSGGWHVTFNGLSFDSQVTEYVYRNRAKLLKLSGDEVAKLIYAKAQDVIRRQDQGEWQEFPEWKLSVKQLDIFKLNHWDNPNRRCSLKWLQYAMDWDNIQDMPIHHSESITTMDQINMIIGYCFNDVKSTKRAMELSKAQINMRNSIAKKYGLKCYSYSNTKIGSELLLKMYCDKTGREPRDVKPLRTKRNGIDLKEVVFPYVSFKSREFVNLLEKITGTTIRNTKGEFKYSVNYAGYKFDYGVGGMHQCIKPGIYESNDEYIIMDLDVASLYPSIACVNEMYPAHLGPEFFQVYKNEIVDVRLAEKKKGAEGDKAIIEGFKEAANASYGNSNSVHSWLFDTFYTLQTTINGQLLISSLVEEMLLSLSSPVLLQTNTDGATLMIKRSDMDKYKSICKAWEEKTKLVLEFSEYKKMIIWDVNNYIAIYTSGKTKCKGRFEWEDLQNHKVTHLHKNKSFLIVPKAIYHYFVHDIPPEKFLADNRNIFDYCAGVKIKGDWKFRQTCVINGEVVEEDLQKTLRYYISRSGCKIIKRNTTDNRAIQLQSGRWMQTVFNEYEEKPWQDYGVDEEFYLEAIYGEIASIKPANTNQLTLF